MARRSAKKTVLIYGEGANERVFLEHLKDLYVFRGGGIHVAIKKGKGGAPVETVVGANKVPGDFDQKWVVLDNDKTELEIKEARKKAKELNIGLFENEPCLESLLLLILCKGKNFKQCKKEFEKKYISSKKRSNPLEYRKLFTKELLEKRRKDIPILNKLILIMEGVS